MTAVVSPQSRVISVRSWYLTSFVILTFYCLPLVPSQRTHNTSLFFSLREIPLVFWSCWRQKANPMDFGKARSERPMGLDTSFFSLSGFGVLTDSFGLGSSTSNSKFFSFVHDRLLTSYPFKPKILLTFKKSQAFYFIGPYLLYTHSIAQKNVDCNWQIAKSYQ